MNKTLLLISFLVARFCTNIDLVPDKDCAINIAKVLLESKSKSKDYKNEIFKANLLNDSLWIVTTEPEKSRIVINGKDTIIDIYNGGAIYIEIKKRNCEITNFLILK